MMPPLQPVQIVYALLILLLFVFIAIGRLPGTRMNRTTIAVAGAGLLLAVGAIGQEAAFHAIDLGTIVLLFALMVLNVNLRLAGFFAWVGARVLSFARSPHMLLGLVIAASGVLSALFLNDPVCVLFTPLVVDIALKAGRDPIPYLMGLATGANIGSTATITGNPQNLLIGQASGIPYLTFLSQLGPVALLGMGAAWLVILLVYRPEFARPWQQPVISPPRVSRPLMRRALLVTGIMLVAFLVGAPPAAASLAAVSLLLVSRLKPARLLAIDWGLLAFFAGLFIITGALATTGLSARLFEIMAPAVNGGVATLSLASAGLSNLVSNVPAVLLFRPVVPSLENPELAWLTLAMSSTLAGNLTLLGSVANLIVAEIAAERGVKLTFREYLKAGVPITVITLVIGIAWLTLAGR
jgi:Na+/H+ antiporter NhaD/arsenite permease-like protein